jgi:hypothetical protein
MSEEECFSRYEHLISLTNSNLHHEFEDLSDNLITLVENKNREILALKARLNSAIEVIEFYGNINLMDTFIYHLENEELGYINTEDFDKVEWKQTVFKKHHGKRARNWLKENKRRKPKE